MFKDEKAGGVVQDECNAQVKNREAPLPPTERDSQKKWGLSIKRGCIARFTVKCLLHAPHISEICIFEFKLVNKDGLVVHGGMKFGDRVAFSAHLSPIVKEFIDGCLHEGYIVHQIMKKHLKFLRKWEADGKEITRDLLITPKDIRNIAHKLAKETYMLHPNDAQSVLMWVQKNPDKIFHYIETDLASPIQVDGQLNGANMPFTIGIQTHSRERQWPNMGIMEVFPLTLRLRLMTRRYVHFCACFHKIVFRHDFKVVFIGTIKLASSYSSFVLVTLLHLYSVSNQSYLHIDYTSAGHILHLHGI